MDKKEHFVSVGSNINPEENIKEALKIISEIEELKISAISSFYETPPLNSKGEIDNSQPKFINGVIKVVSFLEESEVQAIFEEIERKMGRIKSPETKFAPREIDLDVILSISFDGKIRYIHTDVFEKFFILPCVFEIDKRTVFLIRNFISESVIGNKFNFEEKLDMFRSYAVKLPEFSEDIKNFLNKRG
jgi:2-amino-4-hydroxy-6-hydroxymethyldihydropteridine diphosphokinase